MEDNRAAIFMLNNQCSTNRTRRINIQHFALEEWVKRHQVKLKHIPGIINPTDSLTKALGWILHARHVDRLMGYLEEHA